ncbi:hypothetical protein ACHAXM_000355 [Skeletonema potamos]
MEETSSSSCCCSSAISLYQVFAGVPSKTNGNSLQQFTCIDDTTQNQIFDSRKDPTTPTANEGAAEAVTTPISLSSTNHHEKRMATLHYFTTSELLQHTNNLHDNNSNDNNYDGDESNGKFNTDNDGDCTDNEDCSTVQQQHQHDDDDDRDQDKKDNQHSLHNHLQNLLTKYRARLGTLVLSITALWIYSQLRSTTTTTSLSSSSSSSSKRLLRHGKQQQQRRQRQLLHHFNGVVTITMFDRANKAMNVVRYLLRMISMPVSCIIRRHLTLQQQQHQENLGISTTTATTTTTSWKDAIPTPLSHLLAVAESGNISKVIVHGGSSMLTYLHDAVPSSSSSSSSSQQHPNNHPSNQRQQQQQRWSKTTLPPSQNSTILNQIISTLLQKGCHDITTIPESTFARFWNGPAIMALPFVYLGALYWIMKRLQREQLEDDDVNGGGSGGGDPSTTTTTATTTFADVAGINSSLQELSEVVSCLRRPTDFHRIGASPPRGILMHGPPGTGKTLLARAIAGELTRKDDAASCLSNNNNNNSNLGQSSNTIDAFAVCSGSEFVETYVGRGAARVRTLFRKVREDALRNFQKRHRRHQRERRGSSSLRRLSTDVGKPSECHNNRGSVLTRAMSDVSERIAYAWEGLQSLVVQQQHPDFISSDEDDVHDTPLAIIFIDEIDALAKQRDSGVGFSSLSGGNDEREQTLNQLLTEMDGFKTGGPTDSVTVIVIAATNRPHVLDPAILRSGRFDRHVAVHLPDCQGREDILRLHARRIRYDESSVNFRGIAKITPQFSGADLKCLINEAALLAVRSGSKMVLQDHLVQAAKKAKKSRS